jgi:hypothetical protein
MHLGFYRFQFLDTAEPYKPLNCHDNGRSHLEHSLLRGLLRFHLDSV